MIIPTTKTIQRGRPVTLLRAWVEAVDGLYGRHLGEEHHYMIKDLAEDAEIGLQTARYAERGDQCGPRVARKISNLTGLDCELVQSMEARESWEVPIPQWVEVRIASRLKVRALKEVKG